MTGPGRFAPLVALAWLALPIGSLASQSLDTAAVLASARPQIDEANRAWVTGFRLRNAIMVAAAYADSGLFIAPDGSVTRGRTAITKMYSDRFTRLNAVRDDAVIHDGIAVVTAERVYEWGHAWLETASATPGGAPVRNGGTPAPLSPFPGCSSGSRPSAAPTPRSG